MFGMVSSLLLEPLPFRDADQLVTVTLRQPQGGVNRGGLSFLDFVDYQEQAPTFAAMAGVESRSLTFSDTDEPERVLGAAVAPAIARATRWSSPKWRCRWVLLVLCAPPCSTRLAAP